MIFTTQPLTHTQITCKEGKEDFKWLYSLCQKKLEVLVVLDRLVKDVQFPAIPVS